MFVQGTKDVCSNGIMRHRLTNVGQAIRLKKHACGMVADLLQSIYIFISPKYCSTNKQNPGRVRVKVNGIVIIGS